ncbi:hypothetical protein O9H85_15435 [Paenibacillus filicis]|uniref:Uncharacterized protein n=1 Tax=Paenibacillus gyeongsangnamensis TaxID=3388067 RepID=A0ABT4QAK1_9BACL|nr:hypothetical protein [Paenibacillus filicis]MCZ8513801.1 hypothetical protein [Paenibacillus filicis]
MVDLKVIERENGMVEVQRNDGEVMVIKKEIYELVNDLIAQFEKTDHQTLTAAIHYWSSDHNDRNSKILHDAAVMYLDNYSTAVSI